jgi:translation elongation factor EF-Ts
VNASEIDFVNRAEDFQELLQEILRQNRSPVEYYNPLKKKGTQKEDT